MTNETMLSLVRAYLTLADMHRKAAQEEGDLTGRCAWHLVQAETAEVAAMGWHHRANRRFQSSAQEVSHA